MNKKVTAIVLAAGQGKRMNSEVAKQFLCLNGKPILYYSLKSFEESSVDEVILVTGKGQIEYCRENIVEGFQLKKVKQIIEGGKERYDSVYRALVCASQSDFVLIHDGARPFITVRLIESIIEKVKVNNACLIGTPVKETIKIVGQDGYITSTPDRSTLWAAQTPQAFKYDLICSAYDLFYKENDLVRSSVTDDSMVFETFLKQPVKMLMGDYNNIKITTPEDMLTAEAIEKGYCFNIIKK